jgi:hypothetical protein
VMRQTAKGWQKSPPGEIIMEGPSPTTDTETKPIH